MTSKRTTGETGAALSTCPHVHSAEDCSALSSIHMFHRSTNADFRGSGFDRGHLAAAANHKWSQKAMDDTFYLSNVAPQVGLQSVLKTGPGLSSGYELCTSYHGDLAGIKESHISPSPQLPSWYSPLDFMLTDY